ncbi:MAG: M48 family metallopeptidase [Verrucomicrobia bacterium]|nr:M48 family metallopeptidase [Verrucomicrobiota bacterium]
MSQPSTDPAPGGEPPLDIRRNRGRAVLLSLLIPTLTLAFYVAAPFWLERKLHEQIAGQIAKSTQLTPAQKAEQTARFAQIDFHAVCRAPRPGFEKLRASFAQSGIAANFTRLRWGLGLATALMAILLGAFGAVTLLNRRARRSRDALIGAYQLSWKIAMAAAVADVVLLAPLLTYASYEITVLLADQYYPKLIIALAIGGGYALWHSAKILLARVPMEFTEGMARSVTPAEAPELWAAVRTAAARLHTAPPDHIVVGMQLNFYVTELAVNHGTGRAEGRTLYLSHPALAHLAPDEVLAIIGHELGHFIGDDTRLTREFYPLRHKANATMFALAQSGWVGWPSCQLLNFFGWSFAQTEQETSRQRELLADKKAAELTSPAIAARALVKIHVLIEAFQRQLHDTVTGGTASPLEVSLRSVVRAKLLPQPEFWTELFDKAAPHPLDSHPTLLVRLASLGQAIGPDEARAMAAEETPSAAAAWLTGREGLFTTIVQEAGTAVARMREQTHVIEADVKTDAGKELLAGHFPEKRWKRKSTGLWIVALMTAVATAIFIAIAAATGTAAVWWMMAVFGVCLFGGTGIYFRRHFGAELVLAADGLSYSGWHRRLEFADVETVTAHQSNGLSLIFRLKTKQEPIWKGSIPGLRRKTVSLPIDGFDEKGQVVAETIFRYFTRQIGPG